MKIVFFTVAALVFTVLISSTSYVYADNPYFDYNDKTDPDTGELTAYIGVRDVFDIDDYKEPSALEGLECFYTFSYHGFPETSTNQHVNYPSIRSSIDDGKVVMYNNGNNHYGYPMDCGEKLIEFNLTDMKNEFDVNRFLNTFYFIMKNGDEITRSPHEIQIHYVPLMPRSAQDTINGGAYSDNQICKDGNIDTHVWYYSDDSLVVSKADCNLDNDIVEYSFDPNVTELNDFITVIVHEPDLFSGWELGNVVDYRCDYHYGSPIIPDDYNTKVTVMGDGPHDVYRLTVDDTITSSAYGVVCKLFHNDDSVTSLKSTTYQIIFADSDGDGIPNWHDTVFDGIPPFLPSEASNHQSTTAVFDFDSDPNTIKLAYDLSSYSEEDKCGIKIDNFPHTFVVNTLGGEVSRTPQSFGEPLSCVGEIVLEDDDFPNMYTTIWISFYQFEEKNNKGTKPKFRDRADLLDEVVIDIFPIGISGTHEQSDTIKALNVYVNSQRVGNEYEIWNNGELIIRYDRDIVNEKFKELLDVIVDESGSELAPPPEDEGKKSKSGGGCSNCTPPTMGVNDHNRQLVENGFAIDGDFVNVEYFKQNYPTHTAETDTPIKVTALFYEDTVAENIEHVEFNFDEDRSMGIEWTKDEELYLNDKSGILNNVDVIAEKVDDHHMSFEFTFEITKPMEFKSVNVYAWDTKRNSVINHFEKTPLIIVQAEKPVAVPPIPSDDDVDYIIEEKVEIIDDVEITKNESIVEPQKEIVKPEPIPEPEPTCRDGFNEMERPSGKVACITDQSVTLLVARGWSLV